MPSRTGTSSHRVARLTALVTAVVTVLLLGVVTALPALATPPLVLPDQITDQVGAVEGHTAEIQASLDELESTYGIRLWIVFVDTFDNVEPRVWADQTFIATGLDVNDYLLAVAMSDRTYGYVVDEAFLLEDTALARVATSAERHLAENPARAVTTTASSLGRELAQARLYNAQGGEDTESGSGMIGVVLAIIAAVFVVVGVLVYLAFQSQRQGASRYDPYDTTSGPSSWPSSSSDSWWSSGGSSGSDWSSSGGGGGTRGGSGSF